MTHNPIRYGIGFVAALVAIQGMWSAAPFGQPAFGKTVPIASQYVALGGSGSLGFQPTRRAPRGQSTDHGYAEDLIALTRHRWPGLELVQLGCPGATTATFLTGRGRCRYAAGSQLAAAVTFLRTHPTTRLITVDLGFNNIRGCLVHGSVDQVCVSRGLHLLRMQLSLVLTSLRHAAGKQVQIVGVGHYDPFVAASRRETRSGQRFATTSVGVVERLNATLSSVYHRFGIPMANVAQGFDLTDTKPSTSQPSEPLDVMRVCQLTWMCARHPYGPNLHPDDAGYRAMAEAIARALPRSQGH